MRSQADGAARLIWSVIDLGDLTESSAFIYSPVFAMSDGTLWKLVLQPKQAFLQPNNEVMFSARLSIVAVPNAQEVLTKGEAPMKRRLHYTASYHGKIDGTMLTLKSWQGYANFTDEEDIFTLPRFFTVRPDLSIRLNHNRLLTIGLILRPEVYMEADDKVSS